MHHSAVYLVSVLWLIFLVYWAIAAGRSGKKDVYLGGPWRRWASVIIVLLLLGQLPYLNRPMVPRTTVADGVAILFVAAGLAFAFWARRHLGANWSTQPAVRQEHELVTSGPYGLARHPIYTGILLALLGSALTDGVLWFMVFLTAAAAFVSRAKAEEQLMTQRFPDKYPAYRRRTKAFVPFVL